LLLDAALASAPGYDWSTAAFDADDPVLRSLRATLDLAEPVTLGIPGYCSHMRRANGDHDWL
ncbi:N-acetyltransferase, partial [Amycolatopsis sp. NPDC000673]